MTAPVNKIIPISTVDGPGARTAVFLQGCNIRCAYCHNPETQCLCQHCGACVPGCPAGALALAGGRVVWDAAKCVACDGCLAACPHSASPRVRDMTPGQVMDEVRKSLPFVRGITLSGGECTLYPAFLEALFRQAKTEGLSCLLDSNGSLPLDAHPELLALCDGVMLDVKAWDPGVYAALTGGFDNAPVKRNLALLAEAGKLTELRVVCLPGRVDAEAVVDGIAEALGDRVGEVPLKLIGFRPQGVRGVCAGETPPTAKEMKRLNLYAKHKGFVNAVVV